MLVIFLLRESTFLRSHVGGIKQLGTYKKMKLNEIMEERDKRGLGGRDKGGERKEKRAKRNVKDEDNRGHLLILLMTDMIVIT